MPVRYARKRIDIGARELTAALLGCAHPGPAREPLERTVAAAWPSPDQVVVALSARSAFDLLLTAVDWPPGSEIIFTGITIPHLPRLAREHGYVPVGADLDLRTLAPTRLTVTPRTRAVVVAQLFGGRVDLTWLRDLADQHGLLLVDDRAECFTGQPEPLGAADVALHSFGTIKTATCAGGGLALIADPALADRMRAVQRTWPTQTTAAYAGKVARLAAMCLISTPATYPLFWALAGRLGGDAERVVRAFSRGFDDERLLAQLRRRPSAPLLRTLAHRLQTYDPERVRARAAAGARVAARLPSGVLLGESAAEPIHWLFPVVVPDPAGLIAAGRAAGFDLTAGASVLTAVDRGCQVAAGAMARVVYLPVSAAVPDRELDRLTALVIEPCLGNVTDE